MAALLGVFGDRAATCCLSQGGFLKKGISSAPTFAQPSQSKNTADLLFENRNPAQRLDHNHLLEKTEKPHQTSLFQQPSPMLGVFLFDFVNRTAIKKNPLGSPDDFLEPLPLNTSPDLELDSLTTALDCLFLRFSQLKPMMFLDVCFSSS